MAEGTAASFACPHCGAVYPLRPQLVDRPIRCRECKAAFQVDGRGRAVPVITNRPATGRHAPEEPRAPTEAPAPPDADDTERPSTTFRRRRQQPDSQGSRIMQAIRRSMHTGRFEDQADTPASAADRQVAGRTDAEPETAGRPGEDLFADIPAREARSAPRPHAASSSTIFALRRQRKRDGADADIREALRETAEAGQEETTKRHRTPTGTSTVDARSVRCPHCETTYPFDPRLVDQVIRCRECKGVFRVFEDGLSAPVVANRPPSRKHRAPLDREKSELVLPEPGETTDVEVAPGGRDAGRRSSRVMRAKDLMAAMSKGLEDISEQIPEEQPVRRPAPQPSTKRRRGSSDISDLLREQVVLTDEGRERQRLHRLLTVVVLLVLGLLAWWLLPLFLVGEERQALHDLVVGAASRRGEADASIGTIEDRAWRSGARVMPVINCYQAEFDAPRTCALAPLRAIVRELRGRCYHVPSGRWYPAEKIDQVLTRWRRHLEDHRAPERFGPQLEADGIIGLVHADLLRRLDVSPLAAEERRVLRPILSDPAPDALLQRFVATEVPDRAEILPFHGRDGSVILPGGGVLRRQPYRGLLLRFHRDGRPGEWKVFSLELVDEE